MDDFYQFLPMAKTTKGEPLFTYNSVDTLEKAIEQFNIWTDHYHYDIVEAWVDVINNGERVKCIPFRKSWVPADNTIESKEPHLEFIGKRLRQIISEQLPEALGEEYPGGVVGCPGDYTLFCAAYNCNKGDTDSKCTKCWNQIYIGNPNRY